MNEIVIESLLLFTIVASGTLLSYLLYKEYKKFLYIQRIKHVLQRGEDELLIDEEEQKDEFAQKTPFERVLILSGITLSPLIVALIILAILVFISSLFILYLGHISGGFFGIFFGSTFVYFYFRYRISKRTNEFNRALAVAISVLVKMMQNGVGFEQALVRSIEVSSSKMFKEIFAIFFQEKNTFGEMQAFERIFQLVNSKELRVFALAIKIGRESGGQFSKTLQKLETTIRYRRKMQEKIDVLTREGSFGSYIVVAISVVLYVMLNLNFGGKLHSYYMSSLVGRFELLGIATWIFIGILLNKIITKVEK